MRRGILIVGIVLAILGVLLVGLGFLVPGASGSPQTQTLAPYPTDLCITPSGIGSSTLTVSWTGGSANSQVVLTPATDASCQTVSQGALAKGTGPSGSLSASVSPGTAYAVYVQGASTPVTVTYSMSGITYLMLIGIALLVVGIVVAILGARARPRTVEMAAAEPEEPAAPAAPYARPAPITADTAMPAPVAARSAAPVAAAVAEDEEPPARVPRFMPASGDQPVAAAPAGSSVRPPRTCAKCGTVNESWITNCRKCKRPLASTATA